MSNYKDLDKWVIREVKKLHEKDYGFVFLSGSLIRGGFGQLSDIDYTACVHEKLTHPRFIFRIVEIDGCLRPVSIFFYTISELDIPQSEVDEEYYLWVKGMMSNSKFVDGDEDIYTKIVDFTKQVEFSRTPSHKTLHKSFGKLLELLQKVRKYHQKSDEDRMVYYGLKLAEHVHRLVKELNSPLALQSESQLYQAYLSLENVPSSFEELFPVLARVNLEACSIDTYWQSAQILVGNTFKWLGQPENRSRLDPFSLELLEDPSTDQFIKNLGNYSV